MKNSINLEHSYTLKYLCNANDVTCDLVYDERQTRKIFYSSRIFHALPSKII